MSTESKLAIVLIISAIYIVSLAVTFLCTSDYLFEKNGEKFSHKRNIEILIHVYSIVPVVNTIITIGTTIGLYKEYKEYKRYLKQSEYEDFLKK